MIDECPCCGIKELEVMKAHNLIICFKCKWAIDAEAWVLSWETL